MKQHITPKQLNELSEKGKERLRKLAWDSPYEVTEENKNGLPLLSIGQMIEFLREKTTITIYMETLIIGVNEAKIEYKELSDALWKACKEVLEK